MPAASGGRHPLGVGVAGEQHGLLGIRPERAHHHQVHAGRADGPVHLVERCCHGGTHGLAVPVHKRSRVAAAGGPAHRPVARDARGCRDGSARRGRGRHAQRPRPPHAHLHLRGDASIPDQVHLIHHGARPQCRTGRRGPHRAVKCAAQVPWVEHGRRDRRQERPARRQRGQVGCQARATGGHAQGAERTQGQRNRNHHGRHREHQGQRLSLLPAHARPCRPHGNLTTARTPTGAA